MVAPARVDAPNGSRLRVRRCRVQKGVLWTSEAESLTESEHSRGGRWGALPPNGVFIFCASTLSFLHLSSGSWLSGLPLIPLDVPLSPPRSSLCSFSVSFRLFPATPPAVVYPRELTSCIFIAKYFNFQHYFGKKRLFSDKWTFGAIYCGKMSLSSCCCPAWKNLEIGRFIVFP